LGESRFRWRWGWHLANRQGRSKTQAQADGECGQYRLKSLHFSADGVSAIGETTLGFPLGGLSVGVNRPKERLKRLQSDPVNTELLDV
jgi:hypothetical protein